MSNNSNPPPSASALESTKLQALKELRTLLSELLAMALSDEKAPAAFKGASSKEILISQTENRLAEAWRYRFEAGADRRKAARALDLLPDDEHDQQLLSERFVNDVSYQDRVPLEKLARQLATMSGAQFDTRTANPLGPSSWVEGIRGGMKQIQCTAEERDWLLERLVPLLTARMGEFYAGLNARLTSAGVVGQSAPGRQAGSAAPAQQYAPELVQMHRGNLNSGAVPPGFETHAGGFDAGNEAMDRLLGLLSSRRGSAVVAGEGVPYAAMSTQAPVRQWSQDDIFSILALLQNSYVGGASGAAGASSMGRLQEAMSTTASQLGLAGDAGALPSPAQDQLELVSMLFEALLDGRRLDEKASSHLAQLIIPYVRVAMLDRSLFMQSSHPARRVLNLLVEAFETAAPEVPRYRSLRELGFKVIDRIVEEFSDDVTLFESLEILLAAEVEACRRRAELAERRAADAQSGKERRHAARATAANYLSEAIVGKSLHADLLQFLTGPWQHHQTVLLLREGETGDGVLDSRRLLRDLLDCSEHGALAESDVLRRGLIETLASSGQTGTAIDELLGALSAAFASRPTLEQISSELAQQVAAKSLAAAELAEEQSAIAAGPATDVYLAPPARVAELPVDIVERYQQAPIGTWLDFVGEDGRITSARISWTSPISGRRILSNRRGQRMLVASAQELAEMELDGRIRPRKSESAVDQALHTIADRLEASAPVPA